MSRVNDLRRKATEAVRGREYDRAIGLLGKICDLDPSNGTPRNELGDLHLKTSNTFEALICFSLSARLYSEFGLTNNAVAVFKKILRHDPNHMDSLWGLAEIRREQGIDAEASTGYLDFLARADQIPEAGREAFFARTVELIDHMADDLEILSRLEEIYESCGRSEDVAKVMVAKARQAHLEGEFEVRDRYIDHGRKACDIFDSLPAYHDYLEELGGDAGAGSPGSDPDEGQDESSEAPESGVIEIDDSATEEASTDPGLLDDAAPSDMSSDEDHSADRTVMINTESLDLGFDFEAGDLDDAVPGKSSPAATVDTDVKADVSGEVVVEELVLEGVQDSTVADGQTIEEPEAPQEPAQELAQDPPSKTVVRTDPSRVESETVDLLAEILADESFDVSPDQGKQEETIAEEMQGQIGGDVDASDFGGQYELGIVYMDMGLYDQSLAAFKAAAKGADYRLAAMEMQGTCLLRLSRDGEALEAFQVGLSIEGAPEKAYLGLLYGVGCCLELRGEGGEARVYFKRVAAVDANFLDVSSKLEQAGEPR